MSDTALTSARTAIQAGSKTFSLAARFFPAELQDAAARVYAWCRTCDDQIDQHDESRSPSEILAELRTETQSVFDQKRPHSPAFEAFQEAVLRYEIPREYAFDLLDGMEMDVRATTYETLEELELYCYRVAGTVGLMMSHALTLSDHRALAQACNLGIAMQLTNIARDIREDALNQRVYLPLSWLREAGLLSAGQTPDQAVLSALTTPQGRAGLYAVTNRLLGRADEHYRLGNQGILSLPLRSALAVACASRLYRAIGQRILKHGPDALLTRSVVPRAQQLVYSLGAVLSVIGSLPRRIGQPSAARPTQIWRYR